MTFRSLPKPLGDPRPLSPLVISLPHSGRRFSADELELFAVQEANLQFFSDPWLDLLVEPLFDSGISLVVANKPRAVLDLNRGPWEMAPGFLRDPPPDLLLSGRAQAGLGVVPTLALGTTPLYAQKLDWSLVEARLTAIHHPFHQALTQKLKAAQTRFGKALLIDLHSMPSHLAKNIAFTLSDHRGKTLRPESRALARQVFGDIDHRVAINHPFTGGFITEFHGSHDLNIEAVQVEISRELYLDKLEKDPGPGFAALSAKLCQGLTRLHEAWLSAD